MDKRNERKLRCRLWLAGLLCWSSFGIGNIHAGPAPLAPNESQGTYSVSYESCVGCYIHWLEERFGETGAWQEVGAGTVSFANKGAGLYQYRSVYIIPSFEYFYTVEYSEPTAVRVGINLPVVQSLTVQASHVYQTRIGHYDSDGRPDLFVERKSGGSGNDGTLVRTVLRSITNGFEARVPNEPTAAMAAAWPLAPVEVTLRDINIDGFVDLVMTGIDKLPGMGGMPGQIILAPGRTAAAAPIAVRSIGEELKILGRDLRAYLKDPSYFTKNIPFKYVVSISYDYYCSYYGWDATLYGMVEDCYPIPVVQYFAVPDYSGFAAAAVKIWNHEQAIVNGRVNSQVGYNEIEKVIEGSLGAEIGGWELEELLGESTAVASPDMRRGFELFTALAGIGNASAQSVEAEIGSAPISDAVLLTGRRILGLGPFHTALQYGGSTISAYDDDDRSLIDGMLVSEVNWPPDNPLLTLTLGTIASPLPAPLYWQRLITADAGYSDRLPYDTIPSLGRGGYNSNGYASGLIAASNGISSVPMINFVGGEWPVPSIEYN
jgi:hypothetical protein